DGKDGADGTDGQDGQDGADGEDGSQIFAGTGAPDPGMGATGDFYLDKRSYNLYGPKTSSGWGMALNLKGADGNANVTRYLFPEHDYSSAAYTDILRIPSLSKAEMTESTWLVYLVKNSTSSYTDEIYYPVPGYAFSSPEDPSPVFYNMRYLYRNSPAQAEFQISRQGVAAAARKFDRTEIVRIEASNTIDKSKTKDNNAIIPEGLDVSNYNEVAKYYGFGNTTPETLQHH